MARRSWRITPVGERGFAGEAHPALALWRKPALLALLVAGAVRAAPPVEPDEEARVRLAAYGISLLPAAGGASAWTSGLAGELLAGLELLPPPLRRFPGGPLELELHAGAMPYGMGNGTSAAPEWTLGRQRFHLYALASEVEPRAAYRLERLSPVQREALWRRRALVHAVLQRWDDRLGLSERDGWRRLSGWLRPFDQVLTWRERPLNTYPWAYSRARGRASASLDLVTFAEEALVPAETLEPQAVEADDAVRCQELSKSRFLFETLSQEGLWGGPPPDRGPCPAFDGWAAPDSLQDVEVLLVAASGRGAESLFGHLMLQLVRRQGRTVLGPSFGTVAQPVAFTGQDTPGPGYLVRGIGGGYSLGLLTLTLGDVRHQMTEYEQRTIRRFRLNLTPRERLRALERIWELERRGYFDYFFFTDNCATAVLFMINGVLDGGRRIPSPSRFNALVPTAALDFLARVDVPDPGGGPRPVPLLVPVPGELPSTQDVARRSFALREEAVLALRRVLPARAAAELDRMHAALRSPDLPRRSEAYARLIPLLDSVLADATGPQAGQLRRLAYGYLIHSIRIERYAVDAAEAEAAAVQLAALERVDLPVPPAQAEVAERQRLFEREVPLRRYNALLDRTSNVLEALDRAPKRPYSPGEQEVVARRDAAVALFSRVTAAQGGLVDRYFAGEDPVAWLEADRAVRLEQERAVAARSLPSSGSGRLVVGGGALLGPAGNAVPLLTLGSGVFWEDLGDHRLHGLQPTSETHVLTGELRLGPGTGLPAVLASDLTLVSYRTLRRNVPTERRALLDNAGWGFRAGWDYRADRLLPQRAGLDAEVLAVLDEAPDGARFTLLGIGGRGQARLNAARGVVAVGPRFSLSHRSPLFGAYANALRVEADYSPIWQVGWGAARWIHEGSATASLAFTVNASARWVFVVGPRLGLEWSSEPRPSGLSSPELRASLFVELL